MSRARGPLSLVQRLAKQESSKRPSTSADKGVWQVPVGCLRPSIPLDRQEAGRLARPGQRGSASVVGGPQDRACESQTLVDSPLPVPQDDPVVLVVEVGDGGASAALAGVVEVGGEDPSET